MATLLEKRAGGRGEVGYRPMDIAEVVGPIAGPKTTTTFDDRRRGRYFPLLHLFTYPAATKAD